MATKNSKNKNKKPIIRTLSNTKEVEELKNYGSKTSIKTIKELFSEIDDTIGTNTKQPILSTIFKKLFELLTIYYTMDKNGTIDAIVHDVNGGMFKTDSIRLDMDGGRLIICQLNSPNYESNKQNWQQELEFYEENVN